MWLSLMGNGGFGNGERVSHLKLSNQLELCLNSTGRVGQTTGEGERHGMRGGGGGDLPTAKPGAKFSCMKNSRCKMPPPPPAKGKQHNTEALRQPPPPLL